MLVLEIKELENNKIVKDFINYEYSFNDYIDYSKSYIKSIFYSFYYIFD